MAADIYREAGVIAPHTAFYAVTVDFGQGPLYFGLYTMVEVIEDTLIRTQFSDDSGNVYEAEGHGTSFSPDVFTVEDFEKQTNQDDGDKSDLSALFDAIHSEERTTNPEKWREHLETVFDVDAFLHCLAVTTVIQNGDTYGLRPKNYYLYANPENGRLTWIPWDNNLALKDSRIPLDMSTIGEEWPLIRYLIDDPVYSGIYDDYVRQTIEGPFNADTIIARYEYYWSIINPYVRGIHGEQPGYSFIFSPGEFEQARLELMSHAYRRRDEVNAYLNSIAGD